MYLRVLYPKKSPYITEQMLPTDPIVFLAVAPKSSRPLDPPSTPLYSVIIIVHAFGSGFCSNL